MRNDDSTQLIIRVANEKMTQTRGMDATPCQKKSKKQTNGTSGVCMFTTRCPSCFSLETAALVAVRSVYLNHLSMTCLSRPRVHPSCPEVRVRLKPNKKTFLYSSASSLAFPAFPPPFDPPPTSRPRPLSLR